MKQKKFIIWTLIIIIIITIFLCAIYNLFSTFLQDTCSQEEIVSYYNENKVGLSEISSYLMNMDYEHIDIDKSTNNKIIISVDNENHLEIDNPDIELLIKQFLDNEEFLSFEKENEFLYIKIGSSKDFSQGIVYSKGDALPYIQHADRYVINKIEEYWYYYEIVY